VRSASPAGRLSKQDHGDTATQAQNTQEPKKDEEKKGFFRRLLNVFK